MKPLRVVLTAVLVLVLAGLASPVAAQSPCGDTVVVTRGDTLSRIARRCDTTVEAILQANAQITNPNRIFVGQRLTIPPATGATETVSIFLISEGTGDIGCGDEAVAVARETPRASAPLTRAIEELLSLDERTYGESGLINALYQSDLRIEDITLRDGTATIWLAGQLLLGGVCDAPRVEAQLEQTALQFETVDRAEVLINGTPVEVIGAEGPAAAVVPMSGRPGTDVEVRAFNFPADTPVRVGLGRQDTEFAVMEEARTSPDGTLILDMTIPETADPGEPWVAVVTTTAGPDISVVSNVFMVVEPEEEPAIYVVRPGDTLSRIARQFGVTVQAIVAANSAITNPNLIYIGQVIRIPA